MDRVETVSQTDTAYEPSKPHRGSIFLLSFPLSPSLSCSFLSLQLSLLDTPRHQQPVRLQRVADTIAPAIHPSARSTMSAQCKDILSKPADTRLPLYTQLIATLIKQHDTTGLIQTAQHLLQREGADQYGRTYIAPPALLQLIQQLKEPAGPDDALDVEEMQPVLQQLVDLLRPKAEDYTQPLCECIALLAEVHKALEDYGKAAYTLASFRWDDWVKKSNSSSAAVTTDWAKPERRVEWHVSAAELFLAVNETGSASQQIKRAHALVNELPRVAAASSAGGGGSDGAAALPSAITVLLHRFKTCYARVLDSERRFLEASLRYLELSHSPATLMSENDAQLTLQNAVTCAILAKPSPSRTRVLSALNSDSRTLSLPHASLLAKVYKGRVIDAEEVAVFESLLAEHQKAETSAGMTVVRASVVEHNIAAVARVYRNVGVRELSEVLGVREDECERVACEMIEQGRLNAKIDQVTNMVEFDHDAAKGGGGGGATKAGEAAAGGGGGGGGGGVGVTQVSGVSSLLRWDEQIEDVCLQVNRIVDHIQARYPQFSVV